MSIVIQHGRNDLATIIGQIEAGRSEQEIQNQTFEAQQLGETYRQIGQSTGAGLIKGFDATMDLQAQREAQAEQAKRQQAIIDGAARREREQRQYKAMTDRMEHDRQLQSMPPWVQSEVYNAEHQVTQIQNNPEYYENGVLIPEAQNQIDMLRAQTENYFKMYPPPPPPTVDLVQFAPGQQGPPQTLGTASQRQSVYIPEANAILSMDRWGQSKTTLLRPDKQEEVDFDEQKAFKDALDTMAMDPAIPPDWSAQQRYHYAGHLVQQQKRELGIGQAPQPAAPAAPQEQPMPAPAAAPQPQIPSVAPGPESQVQPPADVVAVVQPAFAIISDFASTNGTDVDDWDAEDVRAVGPQAEVFARSVDAMMPYWQTLEPDQRAEMAQMIELVRDIRRRYRKENQTLGSGGR